MGVITGREAKAIGVYHVFAPVLDVNNNADNPVINVRSFGEDPEMVGKFGTAFIQASRASESSLRQSIFPVTATQMSIRIAGCRSLTIRWPASKKRSLFLFAKR